HRVECDQSSAGFCTDLPRYCPHFGQARCESTGSPQLGQVPTLGATAFQWARRWSRFWRLVRFLGTPISLLLGVFWSQLDAFQGGPARVHDGAVATALAFVEVLAAIGAEALAVVGAERRRRNREQDLFAHRRQEMDLLARIDLFVHQVGIE